MDIREVIASQSEALPISECHGRISSEFRCLQGQPALVYGEEITSEHVNLLGGDVVVRVVKSS